MKLPPVSPVRVLVFLTLSVIVCIAVHAQIADRNVNMVSGTDWPGGDPFLQRQNEPSIAVSTRNPLHLLAGANDYRTVDLPGLPDGEETGDAWLGIFKSFDGGRTWRSTLLPGYPQDSSQAGQASPLKGFAAAADPTVRPGTNGLFYLSGIVLNRGNNALSKLFVARFIDNNNKETGDPIKYLSTVAIETGTAGQFIDKPYLAVDIPRAGAKTCTIGGQSFPGGNVYLAYTMFVGGTNNTRTKLMLARSMDCGATWGQPTKLSEGNQINQGATLAINPQTGALYVAWRRFKSNTESDAILIAKSTDGGKSFTKATEVASFTPFEQGTTAVSFRTNAFPTMAVDANGRVYVAWSQRGVGPSGDARIVVYSSADGTTGWSQIPLQDNSASANNPGNPNGRGHQIMPALTFAAGKLVLVYYDLREDSTVGIFTAQTDSNNRRTGKYFETREPRGDLLTNPAKVFSDFIMDAAPAGLGALQRRHTIDVRVAQAVPNPSNPSLPMVFNAFARVSDYKFGSRPGMNTIEQLQVNPPNLPMFKQGTVPFFGDYLDVASTMFLPTPGGTWVFNTAPSNSEIYHAAWTDNRDVRPPPGSPPDWTKYTPPYSPANTGQSKFDPTKTVAPCDPQMTGSRNQNIYTSVISQGLFAGALGNSKPLGTIQFNGHEVKLQRAFSVFVQNTSEAQKSFRLTIQDPQPVGGQASFQQFSLLTTLDVSVAARSSITRTVFVTSTDRHARVVVNVAEITAPAGNALPNGLQGSVILNPDIANPDIANPDIANPDIANPDIANSEVYNPDIANPDIANPDIANPDIANPDIANPDIANPDIANPDIANPDIANPDIANPDIANPDIANPDIANPDIANPDIANDSITDATWKIRNTGNTTASYNVKLLLNGSAPVGFKFQLILTKSYTTPAARSCNLGVENQNVLLASILNPTFSNVADLSTPDLSPAIENATVAVAPGETANITLRILDPDKNDSVTFNPLTDVTPVVIGQAVNTTDALNGSTQPPITLTITTTSLPNGLAGTPYSATLQAIGGIGAKTWSISSGSLPDGLTLNSSTGQISGTPTTGGISTFTVQAQDSQSPTPHTVTRNLTLTILEPLAIATASVPDWVDNVPYSTTLQATGGTGVRTWSISAGSLPPGLNLASGTGQISGTPTTFGIYNFTAQVQDSAQPTPGTATRAFTMSIIDPLMFELYPNGAAACPSCPVTNEFASRGVLFSFTPSLTSITQTNAQLVDSTNIDPAGPTNHSITNPALPPPGGGFADGVLKMTFTGAPQLVTFRLRGPDIGTPYTVRAYDMNGALISNPGSGIGSFYTPSAACCGQYRQELWTLNYPNGISRVEVDATFYLIFLDNLQLQYLQLQ